MNIPFNIVCWSDKGGVGKTTLATSLHDPLCAQLVDTDPQGDAIRWAQTRGQDALVIDDHEALLALMQTPGLRLIDCAPGQGVISKTAVALADLLVIPTRTGHADMVGLARSLSMARTVRAIRPELRVGLVLNLARDTGRAKGVEAALRAQAGEDFAFLGRLHARVAVEEAYADSRTLLQVGGAATYEFRQVLEAVRDLLPTNLI